MTENAVQEARKPSPALLTPRECDERNSALNKALRERALAAEGRSTVAEDRAAAAEAWKGRMGIALLALVGALIGVRVGWLPHF